MRISDWSSDVCSSDLHLPAGDYRCRTIKVGARTGTLGYIAYSWFRCRVDAGQGAASLTKLTGSQRPVGRIFPDNAKRQIFLGTLRSEEHTSELQSLMRISYAVFCLKKKNQITHQQKYHT